VDKFLIFGITGLVLAAIYAVIASGLVLTYTTTGIFNFAHGATGMLAAFAYWQLRFAWDWPAPIALFVVLVLLAPGFGLLLERYVMRGLHDTSDTVRLVVTIALLSGLIAFARWVWDPNVARPMRKFFASADPVAIGPTSVTVHQIITVAVAIAVAVGLRILLYRTRAGVTMRATVDDRSLAVLNGSRPDRSNRLAWALGCSLAALGGILIAPNVALDAGGLSLLIVSAYAAAIFGRLRSIPMTFVGAIVVGCTESFLTGYLPSNEYLPGLRLAAPALILFIVLLVLPNPRLRGRLRSREEFPVPSWAGTLLFGGAVIAFALALAATLDEAQLIGYAKIFPLAVIALSFVMLVGFSGQISLCQMGLAGFGAMAAAHLGGHGFFPLTLLAAALIAALVGAAIALPALRLSGIYLALGTAAFAIVLDRWVFSLPDFSFLGLFDVSLFNQGSVDIAPPELFGVTFEGPGQQAVLSAVVFALLSLAIVAVRRGSAGRRLLATKDSEAACATLGGSILGTKVAVFAASAGIAGIGGALYSMQAQTVSPTDFEFVSGLSVFVLTVVGGVASVGGALFAGVTLNGALPLLASLTPGLVNLLTLLPGLAGVALGKNPNGAVSDLRRQATTVIDRIRGRVPEEPIDLDDVPLEWRGVRRPWQASDGDEIDGELGLVGSR
jgi:branched-chain amino acid transport system permease protein